MEIPPLYAATIAQVDRERREDEQAGRAGDVEVLSIGDVLTATEVAQLIGIKPASIYRYLQRQTIPQPMRVGRTLLWPRAVIEEWQERRVLQHKVRPTLRAGSEKQPQGRIPNPGGRFGSR